MPTAPGRLVDRRLIARVPITRRYLVAAVAVGLASTACVVVQAVLLASIISRVLLHRADLGDVRPAIVGLAVAFVVRALLLWAGEVAAQSTSATVAATLRRSLLGHALGLGPTWLAGERAGELSLTANRGVSALDAYFGRYVPQAVLAALAPPAILLWVLTADWVSALILLVLVALVPVAMVSFGRRATRQTTREWRRLSALSARFLEVIQGLPTLRAFGRAAHGRREVAASTENLRQATMGTLRVAFLSALAMELIAALGVGLVAMVLGFRLLGGTVALSTALAVLLVAPEVFLPLRRAGAEFHASAEGQAAATRILDVLDLPLPSPAAPTHPSDLSDPADPAHPSGPSGPSGVPDPAMAALAVRQLGVTYPGRGAPAVGGFDLDLAPGEHVALVGPSGCGKSTVIGVLMGFVVPDAGSVTVGGADLARLDIVEWRHRIAWVPQRPHIFRGTLEDNLRMGDPAAPAAGLGRALTLTGLDELVGRLPRGLATPLGDGGLRLSAGEGQRVALARAVLRDAALVLLDEPAAHLDGAAEAALRESLAGWFDTRSVLVGAHRPQLVGRIDRVVPMGTPAPGAAETGGDRAAIGAGR